MAEKTDTPVVALPELRRADYVSSPEENSDLGKLLIAADLHVQVLEIKPDYTRTCIAQVIRRLSEIVKKQDACIAMTVSVLKGSPPIAPYSDSMLLEHCERVQEKVRALAGGR